MTKVFSADFVRQGGDFPASAGILLGAGLGGLFDGIVVRQILQWHHMLSSAGYPSDTLHNLRINTLWDGVFHAATFVFIVVGLAVLWRHAHRRHMWWSTRLLVGTVLIGFGACNLVEGVLDHHLLGLHHVNETVPRSEWIYWDLAFLLWGLAMFVAGWWLQHTAHENVPFGDWRRKRADADTEPLLPSRATTGPSTYES